MIEVLLGPRLLRAARALSPEARTKLEAALASVAAGFRGPGQAWRAGLAEARTWNLEGRVDLQRRIVFVQEPQRLMAFDLMSHDEVRAWLKRLLENRRV